MVNKMTNPRALKRSNELGRDALAPYRRGLGRYEEELTPRTPTFAATILLNGEHLPFSNCPVDTREYPDASLQADSRVAIQGLINLVKTFKPDSGSCIKAISYTVENGAFMLKTEFNSQTNCTKWINAPSNETKTKACHKMACAGECIDPDMRKIFARILPELYGTTQR